MQLVFFLWNKRRKRDLLNIIRLNFQFANRNVENKNKKTKQTGWNNSLGRVFPISINCWEFRTVESHRKNQSIFAWTMARLSLVNAIRIERNDMQTSRAENFGESNRMHKPYIYYQKLIYYMDGGSYTYSLPVEGSAQSLLHQRLM